VRKDLGTNFEFPLPDKSKQEKEKLTLRHVLDMPENLPNQVHWGLSPQALDMIQYISDGGSWKGKTI
jgi:DNA (cytosine-5)-methyltransferase 1